MPPELPDHSLIRLRARPETIYVSKGRTVLATGRDGFVDQKPDQGLFVHQTRLLSRHRYLIDGHPPHAVSISNVAQHSWLGYYIAPAPKAFTHHLTVADVVQKTIELRLSRYVGDGLHEDVDLANFTQENVSFTLELDLDADFADQDETRGKRRQAGQLTCTWVEDDEAPELRFDYEAHHSYEHQGEKGAASIRRGLRVRVSNTTTRPRYEGQRIVFAINLGPSSRWHCCVDFIPVMDGRDLRPIYRCRSFRPQANDYDRFSQIFMREATRFASSESMTLANAVVGTLEQGKRDLDALRLHDLDAAERAWTTAAGLPTYIALFGRDALTVAWEAAPVTSDIMRGTLPVLAKLQGKEMNDWRDEQAGRMLHEAHTGPLAALNYTPKSRYYGSITTSGFYPFVVAQLWHWTGDKALVKPYLEPAIAALKWLDEFCDEDRDGFCEYKTRSELGLENQAWKDSGDAIVYEDGSQVPKPVATCEEQGIVYAAMMNLAEVLWWFDRGDEAKYLYKTARKLKKRFNDAFWMENEGFFAMALDPDKRQVGSIGSNALHCVATGIADRALVPRTLERLFAEDMFTGWGVRTLSSLHPAFNPYSYHRGTVWPVEHGPFAIGAYRYGCHDYVERICRSQFETAALFDFFRLPECIAGHQRDEDHPFPAVYPAANSPQAWSATTAYTLLQAMLGLQPFAPLRILFIDPWLPAWLPEITLSNLHVADATITIRFFRKANGQSGYQVLDKRGSLRVLRQPSPWSLTASYWERAKGVLMSLAPGH
ncbi:amylo-alpha-1,6-glucosidase [Sinorhizobium numidicum]|uniref:Amylo-alpha-1,6-glucosidase n=1 Tax=Sinorhizobium numidicum TaxID=680248 RepID=A0ABY8CPB7_9HYPH|nr:glycogen debranching N-terminal domain-containing protein [Sinorhizobium numidicum]WEX74017.1 amylo-alpha-1,6-glucosidase [Sinorhizobium numidicum]WEX80002.1 amylo-alpha-1,6-glucosidase [Sinorhizobium numidicum]